MNYFNLAGASLCVMVASFFGAFAFCWVDMNIYRHRPYRTWATNVSDAFCALVAIFFLATIGFLIVGFLTR